MILILDSGSTKTHCVAINGDKRSDYIFQGINPFYQTETEIESLLKEGLADILKEYVKDIYYYGAGCSFPEKKAVIRNAFGSIFCEADVNVENDLLASARALFGNGSGIACILGTGSNSCLYENGAIVQNVPPLGFILGDEGSGAALGKKLVADCLKNQLPKTIADKFLDRFSTTPKEIMDKVYKQQFPNRFLASLSVFFYENLDVPELYKIVENSFCEFAERNICQYDCEGKTVSFSGSVAYYFEEILKRVCSKYDLSFGTVVKEPIEGLVAFHTAKN